MAAPAVWTLGALAESMAPDGTLTVTAPVLDAGVHAADVTLVVDALRNLTVTVIVADGAVPLTGFQAWSNS